MLTASFISAALLIISIALLLATSARQRYSAKRHAGLELIRQLFQLLETIPQHRGMSNALLQGNPSFKEKRSALQKKIDQQLQRLDSRQPTLAKQPRYIRIKQDWQRITQNLSSLSAAQSFAQHTALVANLLELISDLGQQSKLHSSQQPELRGLLEIGINILPPVTEALGQARGIGAGAAAQESLSPQNRSKLRYLHDQAAVICRNTAEILGHQQAGSNALDFSQCKASIGLFLTTLERELLNAKQVEINSEHYFAIASDAIGQSFEQLYKVMDEADRLLQSECAAGQRRLNMARAATFITPLMLAAVLALFS